MVVYKRQGDWCFTLYTRYGDFPLMSNKSLACLPGLGAFALARVLLLISSGSALNNQMTAGKKSKPINLESNMMKKRHLRIYFIIAFNCIFNMNSLSNNLFIRNYIPVGEHVVWFKTRLGQHTWYVIVQDMSPSIPLASLLYVETLASPSWLLTTHYSQLERKNSTLQWRSTIFANSW